MLHLNVQKLQRFLHDNDITHDLSKNVSESVSITCQSVKDSFKDTLNKSRMKNLNRVVIGQININSV